MKVVEVRNKDGQLRYYLEGSEGLPVKPVLKYLKFRDSVNMARNTIKSNCYHLKNYFEYLEERKFNFLKVTVEDLALFINYLSGSNISQKIKSLKNEPIRSARTINLIIGTVINFYDYILRFDEYRNDVGEKLTRFIYTPNRNYKGFLEGIAYNKVGVNSNILRQRTPRKYYKTLSIEAVNLLIRTCNNIRDKFLLMLLFKTGMRIGEALSIWVEDYDISDNIIELKDRGELENSAEIKTVTSPRKIDVDQQLTDFFMEYICEHHISDVETNHIFIKIDGRNKYKAMEYSDVNSLFIRLKKKTGLEINPHIFRHTNIHLLIKEGVPAEIVAKHAGHKNIYTTLNTYVHPSDEELFEAMKIAKEKFQTNSNNEGMNK